MLILHRNPHKYQSQNPTIKQIRVVTLFPNSTVTQFNTYLHCCCFSLLHLLLFTYLCSRQSKISSISLPINTIKHTWQLFPSMLSLHAALLWHQQLGCYFLNIAHLQFHHRSQICRKQISSIVSKRWEFYLKNHSVQACTCFFPNHRVVFHKFIPQV